MEQDQFDKGKTNHSDNHRDDELFSKRLRAGRRRTYFFDVRATKSNDFYLTITESKKRYNDDGYDRHKVFLYKEDFNKFVEALQETVDHIKENLLPEYDFDEFAHREYDEDGGYRDTKPVSNAKTDDSNSSMGKYADPIGDIEEAETAPLEAKEIEDDVKISATPKEDVAEKTKDNTDSQVSGENPANDLTESDEEDLKWD